MLALIKFKRNAQNLWKNCGINWKHYRLNSAVSRTVFDVSRKRGEAAEIERAMAEPDFWSRREYAAEQSEKLAFLKRELEKFDSLKEKLETLEELLKNAGGDEKLIAEIGVRTDVLEKETKELSSAVFFSGKYDKGNAVISVYAGAGGKDAEDWAALLLRMYRRFAELRNWRVKTLHEHWGEYQGPAGWGIKNATILAEAPFAYGYLKKETGVHRLVRVSPFSAKSLRHTSFALVDVMPEFVAPEEIKINSEDLKIDFFRSSGPGGQNVNKRETAVRVTHIPTGIQVASQAERSQERNRELATELLRSRLYRLETERREKERQGIRQEKISIEWGSQIRSYVMHPYQLVKDHRTGVEMSNIEAALDGKLDEFIEAEIKA